MEQIIWGGGVCLDAGCIQEKKLDNHLSDINNVSVSAQNGLRRWKLCGALTVVKSLPQLAIV